MTSFKNCLKFLTAFKFATKNMFSKSFVKGKEGVQGVNKRTSRDFVQF